MTTDAPEPDLTDEDFAETGDVTAAYQPGNPDDDGQDAEQTERPEVDKHGEDEDSDSDEEQ